MWEEAPLLATFVYRFDTEIVLLSVLWCSSVKGLIHCGLATTHSETLPRSGIILSRRQRRRLFGGHSSRTLADYSVSGGEGRSGLD